MPSHTIRQNLPKSFTQGWLDPSVASGLAARSRAVLARWRKTGCKAGLRFCRSPARLKMRFAPEPVKLQFDHVCRFPANDGLTHFARVGDNMSQNTAQAGAGWIAAPAIFVLKTPQVAIYSPELCRFEGPRNGATPH